MDFELRVWHPDDAAGLVPYADNPKIASQLRDVFPSPYRLEHAREYIEECLADADRTRCCRAIVVDGEAVDLRIEADPAGATFTATGLPQGLTLASDGRLYGTVSQVGTYKVTVTAALNGETASETFTIEVKERGARKSSSSGGCDAGFFGGGIAGLALAAPMLARRKRERA